MSGGKWGNPKFDTNPEFSEPETMKAYKFEVLVIDFEQLGGEELTRTLQTNRYIHPTVEKVVCAANRLEDGTIIAGPYPIPENYLGSL